MIGLYIIQSNKFLWDVLVNSKCSLIDNKVKPSKHIRHNFLQTFSAQVNKKTICGKVGRKGKRWNETCLSVVGRSTEMPAGLWKVSPFSTPGSWWYEDSLPCDSRVFHHFIILIVLYIYALFIYVCALGCISVYLWEYAVCMQVDLISPIGIVGRDCELPMYRQKSTTLEEHCMFLTTEPLEFSVEGKKAAPFL